MNLQKPKNKNENGELEVLRDFSRDGSTSTEPWGNPEQGRQDDSMSSHELPMEPRAKVELGSSKHSVFSHFPKGPNCDIC